MNSQSVLIRDLVVEDTSYAKAVSARLPYDATYLSSALNSQLFSNLIWAGDQDLNDDFRSNRWRDSALDERSVQGNIACEPGPGALTLILPVEDHGQLTGITHGRFGRPSVIRNQEE